MSIGLLVSDFDGTIAGTNEATYGSPGEFARARPLRAANFVSDWLDDGGLVRVLSGRPRAQFTDMRSWFEANVHPALDRVQWKLHPWDPDVQACPSQDDLAHWKAMHLADWKPKWYLGDLELDQRAARSADVPFIMVGR